jgi:hypothetical protein
MPSTLQKEGWTNYEQLDAWEIAARRNMPLTEAM